MNKYSQISKEIGLEGTAEIPEKSEANLLATDALNGDAIAFKKIFQIVRFAKIPPGMRLSV